MGGVMNVMVDVPKRMEIKPIINQMKFQTLTLALLSTIACNAQCDLIDDQKPKYMQITKEEITEALDNLIDPYPTFTSDEERKTFYAVWKADIDNTYQYEPEMYSSLGQALMEDIRDDVQNCGRNPLSALMEHAKAIQYLKDTEPYIFEAIIDYLYEQINDHG
jgi:hypothetical protein